MNHTAVIKPPLKVLNLIQCLNLGGMEQSSYLLMKETQGRDISWQVQSLTPAGAGREILQGLNIPEQDNPYEGKFGYKSHLSLKGKIKSFSGDIILVTGPTLTGCLSLKSNPHKKILGIHFCHSQGIENLLRWKLFYKIFGKDYDAIIYHSPFILEEAKKIAPDLQQKFHLVEYSTQTCSLTPQDEKIAAREALKIPKDAFVIGNAGWLISRKRFDVFLRVCAQLNELNLNTFSLIAGDGPLRFELEELVTQLGISEKVKFLGWQKNLDSFYRSLDLLLFNSDSDAFGRTVMEAMGYGVPSVASVVEGGTDAVLIHKENGYLIPSHDIQKLTEYCLNLIQNKKIYAKFQLASIELVRNKFSTEKYIQNYLSVFQHVLKH
jgi:glycosyltransferase involved in cell wall biosynthesis